MSLSQMSSGWLKWTILVSCWLRLASGVNVTVDDTDPSVFYYPPEAWCASSDPYPDTISGDVSETHLSSYHISLSQPRRNSRKSKSSKQRTASPLASINQLSGDTPESTDNHDSREANQASNAISGVGALECEQRSTESDSDGGEWAAWRGDEETDASIRFDFSGTAIYVYGLLPYSPEHTDSPYAVSFSIDGTSYPGATTSEVSNAMIFGQHGLKDGQHSLKVTVGKNADFALNYLQYTPSRRSLHLLNPRQEPSPTTDPSSSTAAASAPPSSSSAQPNKKRNVTTFAAAVGGSVGVLALLSLGLAISIIRRRRLAAKRERLEREDPEYILRQQQQQGMAQTGSNDIVFIPRYFPGTEIPPQPSTLHPGDLPPPYTPPVAPPNVANHHDVATRGTGRSASNTVVQNPAFTYALPPFHPPMRSPYLHHPPPRPSDSPDLTYADIPPDTPPPPPSPELPLRSGPSPASPPNPVPQLQRRPTHVNVAVGSDSEETEHDPPVPPGIVDAAAGRTVCQGQSSEERQQVQRHHQHGDGLLEHARADHSKVDKDDDELSNSSHSSGRVASVRASTGESAPLLASSLNATTPPRPCGGSMKRKPASRREPSSHS